MGRRTWCVAGIYQAGKADAECVYRAFIERFNRTYRTEILDFYLFRTLNEAREITERWLAEYNNERPHESLNNLAPILGKDQKPGSLKKCVELKQVCLQIVDLSGPIRLKSNGAFASISPCLNPVNY